MIYLWRRRYGGRSASACCHISFSHDINTDKVKCKSHSLRFRHINQRFIQLRLFERLENLLTSCKLTPGNIQNHQFVLSGFWADFWICNSYKDCNIVGKRYLLSVLWEDANMGVAGLGVSFVEKGWPQVLCSLFHLTHILNSFHVHICICRW